MLFITLHASTSFRSSINIIVHRSGDSIQLQQLFVLFPFLLPYIATYLFMNAIVINHFHCLQEVQAILEGLFRLGCIVLPFTI